MGLWNVFFSSEGSEVRVLLGGLLCVWDSRCKPTLVGEMSTMAALRGDLGGTFSGGTSTTHVQAMALYE